MSVTVTFYKFIVGDVEDVDVYVLCTVDIQRHGVEVTFAGWLYSEELYDPANLTNLRGSPVYMVKQDKLNAF